MSNSILFVFEGEKTEKQITENLTKFFVKDITNVQCAFCSDIYQLYDKIINDEFLDTFTLLKERNQNINLLSSYSRNDFAEIYLFFDYDGHAPNASDEKLSHLLNLFNEETERGKLYINYPMVESIKHINDTIDFKELKVDAKNNINYKNKVDIECDNRLKNLTGLTQEHWIRIIDCHLRKMNFIVNDLFSIPTKLIHQKTILEKQLSKYILVDSTVAVLSTFPIFLFDYYGVDYISTILDIAD